MQNHTTSIKFDSLRLVVYAEFKENKIHGIDEYRACNMVKVLNKDFIEFWFWCKDPYSFLLFLEVLVNNGYLPIAISTLNGEVYSIRELTLEPREILELGTKYKFIRGDLKAKIVLGHNRRRTILSVIEKLSHMNELERIKLDFKDGSVYLKFKEPVKTTILYDSYLRILRPEKIPPILKRKKKTTTVT